jgi:aryl-alcohol dehydrogenase-like predicted oxidoreductase
MVKQRALGRSGLQVSELSFGAGGYWGMKAFPERQAAQLVDQALEGGITAFDTGPNYSRGNAEERLGRALKGRTDNLVVSTKVGSHWINNRNVKDYSPRAIEASVHASLRRLQLEHLPLLHFHGFPSPAEPAVEAVLKLKEEGFVGALGVSTGRGGAKKALKLGIFDVLMVEYNIIDRSMAPVIAEAREAGVGIMLKSPLAQTLYSRDIFKISGPSDVWYLLRALRNHRHKFIQGRKYRFINDVPGLSASEIALAYVLNNPGVSSAVIGTVKPEHLRSNLRAPEVRLPVELLERIERRGPAGMA